MSGSGPYQASSFATGNNPGQGQTTLYGRPITGGYDMAQPGQYTPYQEPEWLQKSLNASNQPLQNANVLNYGRWGYQNGATNGYGMGQSPWPSAGSITQPNGPPPGMFGGGYGSGYGSGYGQVMPQSGMQTQQMPVQPQFPGQPQGVMGGETGNRATDPHFQAVMNQRNMQAQNATQNWGAMSPQQQYGAMAMNPALAGRGAGLVGNVNDYLNAGQMATGPQADFIGSAQASNPYTSYGIGKKNR